MNEHQKAQHEIVMRLNNTASYLTAEKIVINGVAEEIRAGIDDGMWIGDRDHVRVAIVNNRFDVATLLLEAGAPVDKEAAVAAVRSDNVEILRKVLDANACCDQAFERAIARKDHDCLAVMFEKHPKPSIKEAFKVIKDKDLLRKIVALDRSWKQHEENIGLAETAIDAGNLCGLEVSMEMGVDLAKIDFNRFVERRGHYPIQERAELLEKVIALGAKPRRQYFDQDSPLGVVLRQEEDSRPLDVARRVSALLSAGAQAWRFEDSGVTPLHMACHKRGTEAIPLLVNAGARLMQRCNRGNTPLMHAVKESELDAFKVMLSLAVEREPLTLLMGDSSGIGLLQNAILFSKDGLNAEMVMAMLGIGMDPDLPDAKGLTARQCIGKTHASNKHDLAGILDGHAALKAIHGMPAIAPEIRPLYTRP